MKRFYEESIEAKILTYFQTLREKDTRFYASEEALKLA
jgi:hypothetical protein